MGPDPSWRRHSGVMYCVFPKQIFGKDFWPATVCKRVLLYEKRGITFGVFVA